ncbi:MAG: ABC transporter ATP-binding protein [Planctomycetaceae bacterium]|jgi:ABC-2 type transport system ATP-binding protein|nr:ABC transporter ATP-binding protein [Planctomycetaceae bacterium]
MEVIIARLVRHFPNTKAVDDISFSFHGGQIFGFVGPNGAGKTTTMRILATLDEPTSGDIFLDGVSVVQYPDKVRHWVGYMPDSLPAHKDITVHEYLDFFARAYGLRDPKRSNVVENIEEFTGLVEFRDKTIAQISKGMKQRVSLARAIVHEPAVLVLDEPAAGLDPRARIELRELLKALREQGKAILISSHILPELGEICDGVAFIEKGQLLKAGKIDNIIDSIGLRQTTMIRAKNYSLDELLKIVLEEPAVQNAKIDITGNEVAVILHDDNDTTLLPTLIAKGVQIEEFKQHKAHLEDLFLSITERPPQ